MENSRLKSLRKRVAREAAVLLYTSQEKEYKQAKKQAARTLGARILPSNLEVAEELDRIAEEMEGAARKELLLIMRKEALQIMQALKNFSPKLVGSVWRGMAHQKSDIDILVSSHDPKAVISCLQKSNYGVSDSRWCSVTKMGKRESSCHIYIVLPSNREVEVVVRPSEKMGVPEKCEIYGDLLTGLNLTQLIKVLKDRPLQKFVPK